MPKRKSFTDILTAPSGLGLDRKTKNLGKDVGTKIGNLWDDVTGKTAADKAAAWQLEALDKSIASTEKMFGESMETQKPWIEAGGRGLSQLEKGIDTGRFNVDPGQFQQEDFQFDFEADPGYQFRLEQGMKALEGSAAARGGLFSTNTGDRIQDYAQGLASQEYGNAYNRARGEFESDRAFEYGNFMDDFNRERGVRTDDYNRLAALSGTGQITAGNVSSQQMQHGGNLANIAQQRGNVKSQQAMAGYQGGMNMLNTGLQGLATIGALAA